MRTRKWLLTTVICSGLLLSGSMTDEASAKTGRLLQPNSDWAVSELSTQTGGGAYCALARRFNNDVILTLARNSKDESSIAVDFQKTALNNTQNYHVTLKPGFGQDRAFNVRPVSGKALVIRLGKDYAFYDAMNRSGQLGIDISGESYSFNLPDFSEGQQKLGACLVNIVEPAAGPSASMTPIPPARVAPVQKRPYVPANSTTTASSNTVISSPPPAPAVNAEAQALREENMRLRNALERERRTYEDRYMQEAQSSSMANELKEKLRLLEMENTELRERLAYAPPAAPVPVTPQEPLTCPEPVVNSSISPDVQAELSRLSDENLRLKQDIAAQQAKNGLLEQQLAEKSVPGEAEAAVMASLRERVNRLEEENKSLKSAPAVAAGGNTSPVSLSQLRSVEEQLRYVQADRDKLRGQLDALAQGKQEGLLDISSDNWDLEQATRRFNEAEREIRRLGRQMEEQRAQCAVQKKELEYMLFDPEVAKEEQISKLIELEKENAGYDDKISKLETEKLDYEMKVAQLEQKVSVNTASVEQAEEAAKKVASLERELDEARFAALNQKNTEADYQAIMQERDALAAQSQQLNAKVASLETSLSGLQVAANNAVPVAEVEQLRSERDALVQQKGELSARVANLESALSGIESAAGDSVPLAEYEAIRSERDMLVQQKDELSTIVASLEMSLADIEPTAGGQTVSVQQYEALLQERDGLVSEQYALNDRIASLEAALASIQTASGPASAPPPVMAEPVGAPQAIYQDPYDAQYADSGYDANYAYESQRQEAYETAGYSAPVEAAIEPAAGANLITASALQALITSAQVPLHTPVEYVDGDAAAGFVAYSWDTGSSFGSAEQQVMGSINQFDSLVQDYLQKTKSRCQGDFAAIPEMADQSGSFKVSSFEIACVSPQGGASASILFYNDGNLFTTIAHEAAVEGMGAAMDIRDKIAGLLMQTQVASR